MKSLFISGKISKLPIKCQVDADCQKGPHRVILIKCIDDILRPIAYLKEYKNAQWRSIKI